MALFPFKVTAETSDTFVMPTRALQFKSGAREVVKSGLDRPMEVWDIKIVYTDPQTAYDLHEFLGSGDRVVIFQWQSPRDSSPQDYRLMGGISGTKRNGGGSLPLFFTRSMKFKRTYT